MGALWSIIQTYFVWGWLCWLCHVVVVVRWSWVFVGWLSSFSGSQGGLQWSSLCEVAWGWCCGRADVHRRWAMCCGGAGAWWLLVEEAMSQRVTLACWCSNVCVRSHEDDDTWIVLLFLQDMWSLVWQYFQPTLLPTRHPNPSVHIHPILGIFLMWKLIGYVLKYYTTDNLILVCLISNKGSQKCRKCTPLAQFGACLDMFTRSFHLSNFKSL